ncbi:hypothetical protein ECP03052601_4823 [Escherichia coli P0305260.1]|nr:hypothetical protein ECDEC10C_6044 [Escherichia coli DEC10C]EMZ89319.1 hypothetical protein ECP03052601_4823 [Escherichia coli P0305260.1]
MFIAEIFDEPFAEIVCVIIKRNINWFVFCFYQIDEQCLTLDILLFDE